MSLAIQRRRGLSEDGVASVLPGLRIAAAASLGAGAIHAAAAGVHAEHVGLARIFIVLAAAQLLAGGLRPAAPEPRSPAWPIARGQRRRGRRVGAHPGQRDQLDRRAADARGAAVRRRGVRRARCPRRRRCARLPSSSAGSATTRPTEPRTALFSAVPIIAIAALTVPAMLARRHAAHAHDGAAAAAHDHGSAPRPIRRRRGHRRRTTTAAPPTPARRPRSTRASRTPTTPTATRWRSVTRARRSTRASRTPTTPTATPWRSRPRRANWPPTARRCAPGRGRGTRPSRSTSPASTA